MPFYRKKPVVIEARRVPHEFQSDESVAAIANWCRGCLNSFGDVVIDTLEGSMVARGGDWIIKGVKGEFYPCKPDIFDKTYEEVSAT